MNTCAALCLCRSASMVAPAQIKKLSNFGMVAARTSSEAAAAAAAPDPQAAVAAAVLVLQVAAAGAGLRHAHIQY
eukprot:COSAG01_NODE_3595_length_5895_cov_74.356046_4_plen_75_part_00